MYEEHNTLTLSCENMQSIASQKMNESNELQLQRFLKLTTVLNQINTNIGPIYKKIVPNSDCYLSFATDPILLFEEGISLLAQHGSQSWKEVYT